MPICVAEHDIRRAVRSMLVSRMKETPKIRLQTQRIEIVSARFDRPYRGWLCARVQPGLRNTVGEQFTEAAIMIAQVDVVRIRLRPIFILRGLDLVEALRL